MTDRTTGKPGGDPASQDKAAARPEEADGPAAGTIDSPIAPGETQPGDLDEQAANLGGPIDISPARGHPRRDRREG
ncbi:hypothetical protein [Roseicella frigidaeris]|uniref:Uncharacterized protein n=1 Tax=Roseicella frigidaeris TaxID=2230885 RepID=A0A327MC16_9PROT|nr:hypothetical protein [Roseicella frigidaeris]RAI60147.1 hypothetical protein DOO78_03405 [Roseicella frigidaeris]